MTVLDYILNGIEAELALERELGVRYVECEIEKQCESFEKCEKLDAHPPKISQTSHTSQTPQTSPSYDFVFLHDRPLSEGGVAMLSKIVTAMGRTAENAPLIIHGDLPAAKAYVVLGSGALHMWFPGLRASPGTWTDYQGVKGILVTYSPEYILRFGEVTPAVMRLKREMWNGLRGLRDQFTRNQ